MSNQTSRPKGNKKEEAKKATITLNPGKLQEIFGTEIRINKDLKNMTNQAGGNLNLVVGPGGGLVKAFITNRNGEEIANVNHLNASGKTRGYLMATTKEADRDSASRDKVSTLLKLQVGDPDMDMNRLRAGTNVVFVDYMRKRDCALENKAVLTSFDVEEGFETLIKDYMLGICSLILELLAAEFYLLMKDERNYKAFDFADKLLKKNVPRFFYEKLTTKGSISSSLDSLMEFIYPSVHYENGIRISFVELESPSMLSSLALFIPGNEDMIYFLNETNEEMTDKKPKLRDSKRRFEEFKKNASIVLIPNIDSEEMILRHVNCKPKMLTIGTIPEGDAGEAVRGPIQMAEKVVSAMHQHGRYIMYGSGDLPYWKEVLGTTIVDGWDVRYGQDIKSWVKGEENLDTVRYGLTARIDCYYFMASKAGMYTMKGMEKFLNKYCNLEFGANTKEIAAANKATNEENKKALAEKEKKLEEFESKKIDDEDDDDPQEEIIRKEYERLKGLETLETDEKLVAAWGGPRIGSCPNVKDCKVWKENVLDKEFRNHEDYKTSFDLKPAPRPSKEDMDKYSKFFQVTSGKAKPYFEDAYTSRNDLTKESEEILEKIKKNTTYGAAIHKRLKYLLMTEFTGSIFMQNFAAQTYWLCLSNADFYMESEKQELIDVEANDA